MNSPVADAILTTAAEHRAAGLSLTEQRRAMVRLYGDVTATLQEQIARIEDLIQGERLAEVDAHRAAREIVADERRIRRSA